MYRRSSHSRVGVLSFLLATVVSSVVAMSGAANAVAAPAAPAASAASVSTADAAPLWPEAYYWINVRHSGKVITVPGGAISSYPNYPRLIQQGLGPTYNGNSDWQEFRPVLRKVDGLGRQWYTFHRKNHAAECISTYQEYGKPSFPLEMRGCGAQDYWRYWSDIPHRFLFTAFYLGDGYWTWTGWDKNTTWDISGSSVNDGGEFITYYPQNSPNQQIMLYRVEDAPYINWNYQPIDRPAPPPPSPAPTTLKPDLAMSGTPSYDSVKHTWTASFTNKGSANAGSFTVSMRIDGNLWCGVSVNSLGVGQVASTTCDFTSLPLGNYQYQVSLDNFGTVNESIESNNEYHQLFTR